MNGPSNAGSRDTTEPLDRRLGLLSQSRVVFFKNLTRSHKTLRIQKAQRRDSVLKSRVGVLPTILLTLAFKTTFKRFLILHCACAMVLLPVNKGSVLIRHKFKS